MLYIILLLNITSDPFCYPKYKIKLMNNSCSSLGHIDANYNGFNYLPRDKNE